jgi:hypothetical protein
MPTSGPLTHHLASDCFSGEPKENVAPRSGIIVPYTALWFALRQNRINASRSMSTARAAIQPTPSDLPVSAVHINVHGELDPAPGIREGSESYRHLRKPHT